MATENGEKPVVLIYDDAQSRAVFDARQGALMAGWEVRAYDTPEDALAAFDKRVNAVITTLGNRSMPIMMDDSIPSAFPILRRSNENGVPRAILSSHQSSGELIRDDSQDTLIELVRGNSSDTIIPRVEVEINEVTQKVSSWLISLAQAPAIT